jgi:uncharacterized Zn finger protein
MREGRVGRNGSARRDEGGLSVYYDFKPYVPVAVRRLRAQRELAKRAKKGHPTSPVTIEGRTIARTFWGRAWCDNLERYSDYENRLPRGRTYVRNGSVVDLQVAPGQVAAFVSGSELYEVSIRITPLPKPRWTAICADCAGGIDSLVELLQGHLSAAVMKRICAPQTGLFPAPTEIHLSCSCPDWADMCKHVAAVLYGIGARLDARPELLFLLREVDEKDLIAEAGAGLPLSSKAPAKARLLADEGLAELFGLDLGAANEPTPAALASPPRAATGPRMRRKGHVEPAPTARTRPLARPGATPPPAPTLRGAARASGTKKSPPAGPKPGTRKRPTKR